MNIYLETIIGIAMSLGLTFAFAILAGLLGFLASMATGYKKHK